MKKNIVKEKLAAGLPSVGSWLTLSSSLVAEYLAHVGFDWLVVDDEHSPTGFETTVHCFQAICTTDTMPMARVAWNDPATIKRLLDAGAMGLVIPMVNSAQEARQAVAAMRYPPQGVRSMGGSGRVTAYGADYFTRANDEILCVVQIEHIDAVRAADEILCVQGVDACFVGPQDLGASMGYPPGEQTKHPEFEDAIQCVLQAAKRAGRPAGIHVQSPEDANKRIQQGFRFVALSMDKNFLLNDARRQFSALSLT